MKTYEYNKIMKHIRQSCILNLFTNSHISVPITFMGTRDHHKIRLMLKISKRNKTLRDDEFETTTTEILPLYTSDAVKSLSDNTHIGHTLLRDRQLNHECEIFRNGVATRWYMISKIKDKI